jgi:glutaredoxin
MAVKLYALSTCPYCMKTKKLLNEQGCDYDAVDVDLVGEEEANRILDEVYKLTGRQSFPVILIGDKVISGYNPEEILEALRSEK